MNFRKQLSTLIVLFPAVMSLGRHAEVVRCAITSKDVRVEQYASTAAGEQIDSGLFRELHQRGYGNTAWRLFLPRRCEIATKISEGVFAILLNLGYEHYGFRAVSALLWHVGCRTSCRGNCGADARG